MKNLEHGLNMEMTKYRLGDIAKIFDGPHATPRKTESGPIYLGVDAITEDCKINPSEFAYLSENDYKIWTKRVVPQHKDIVFSYEATLGRYAIIPEDFYGCLGRRLGLVRIIDDRVDYKWLYYFFQSPQWTNFIKSHTIKGSTVNRISVDEMPSYEIPCVAMSEQKKIAAALSALDDKIALNKKMNQKLEAMAKRLYDYWFVQFDFPDENGRPYKTSGGPMTHNPTLNREIPEGWIVVDINNLCDVVDCLHSKKPDYCFENEDSYLLALENITKEGYIDLSEKYYISNQDFKEWTSRICVKENDFLFTNAGRAGDMGMVPEGVSCAIGRNITAVRPKNVNPWYLRCFFKSLYMQEQILNNLDQGSFFMSFNVRSIKKLQVLIPSKK
ncbi:restriction endonuclease subunit S [Fibrobacter sp. UWH1]|uniref:restriction endonuclease subunit S n=1 Tax=Fibrobacter sp. UWH1 TaxID=1964354 RepID=UPI0011318EE7|nr:restriction endonuclease subunit S [Fibrobacter sp. UWH1]